MKMKLLGFALALLSVSVIGLSQLQSQAAGHPSGKVGNAPVCEAKAIGKRGDTSIDLSSPNAKHLAFSIKDNVTTVKFKVTGPNNCKVRLSANSFWAPSQNGRPYSKQILFQRVTKVFTPGSYTMSVKVPVKPKNGMCFYQVDLTYGTRNVTPVIAYGHGKIEGCKPVPKVPKVTIDKKVNGKEHDEVEVGEVFNYQIVVKNTGKTVLKNVVVRDNAPANVQFLSATTGSIQNNKWTATIARLGVGNSKTFTIKAKVTKQVKGTIRNTACVDVPAIPGRPDDCDKATVKVPPVPKITVITVCDLATNQLITIPEDQFDESKHSTDFADCDEVQVCDPETGEIITVPGNEADDYLPVDSDECKDKLTVCDLTTNKIVTILEEDFDENIHSTTLADCDSEEEEVPAELPQTGPAEIAMQLVGAMSLAGASSYYAASRRQ